MGRAIQHNLLDRIRAGQPLDDVSALLLSELDDSRYLRPLVRQAGILRDRGHAELVTYSRKVFLPLTMLCRDVCHYCTFAKVPRKLKQAYMPIEEVVETANLAARSGCKEALFTLGERPELRYKKARDELAQSGFSSTLDYLKAAAQAVLDQTPLMPHLNPGTMSLEEMTALREVSLSMGIMLESASDRLTRKGMPHYGSPDKIPAIRLTTIENAGRLKIPLTTGILIGIGETRKERLESLLAIRKLHAQYDHIQEIIIQNFRAKPDTKMAGAPEPDLQELIWTIATARLLFGPAMSIQAPPNLSPGTLPAIVAAGINDWGGVSPVSPDFVNPEAPWPHLKKLADETAACGKQLTERLTLYPGYALDTDNWVDKKLHGRLLQSMDAQGLPRTDSWIAGADTSPPESTLALVSQPPAVRRTTAITAILAKAETGRTLSEHQIARLFTARGNDFAAVTLLANQIRQAQNGDEVTFVVNRNINYTNVCYFKCQFCAFSKGKLSENLRGKPYDLDKEEIQRRVSEAWERGATEVCMQGGIHPNYTGETYLNILAWVRQASADMHIHAFSPLEIWQGAATLKMPIADYLIRAKESGLNTLPGTAAEVLDDEVRRLICPDKINTQQWLSVMRTAHEIGFKTTATIMYGHVDGYHNWARHLLNIRQLQAETGGFTEFVPLPFVHMEAPMYLKGKARKGPTFREAVLMHAIARITLHPLIQHIQASWVKMGHQGLKACLNAGCDDLGGTLMNESITRAAGAEHGQETSPRYMREIIQAQNRIPEQRTTLYEAASEERIQTGLSALELKNIQNTPARKFNRKVDKTGLLRSTG